MRFPRCGNEADCSIVISTEVEGNFHSTVLIERKFKPLSVFSSAGCPYSWLSKVLSVSKS
jgi:hypothetical protein